MNYAEAKAELGAINRGAYLGGVADLDEAFNLDANGYVIPVSKQRIFDKKYYLCPIPSNQITLSKDGTKQNPGWWYALDLSV